MTFLTLKQRRVWLPLHWDSMEYDFLSTETAWSMTSLTLRQRVWLPLHWDSVKYDFPYTDTAWSMTSLTLNSVEYDSPYTETRLSMTPLTLRQGGVWPSLHWDHMNWANMSKLEQTGKNSNLALGPLYVLYTQTWLMQIIWTNIANACLLYL